MPPAADGVQTMADAKEAPRCCSRLIRPTVVRFQANPAGPAPWPSQDWRLGADVNREAGRRTRLSRSWHEVRAGVPLQVNRRRAASPSFVSRRTL